MIDGGGAGRDINDDNRMELNEWLAGYSNVIDHGFVALQGISTKAEALAVFKMMDDNGGGMVLLDEWSFFLKNCEIAADTPIGKLLAADEAGGVGKKESLQANSMPMPKSRKICLDPVDEAVRKLLEEHKKEVQSPWAASAKAGSSKDSKSFLKRRSNLNTANSPSGPSKSAEELQTELKEWISTKPPFQSESTPNSFGLSVGKTASASLNKFISVFEPLAAETPEGEVLRAEGFLAADPNGENEQQ
jgi:hypothetical protein